MFKEFAIVANESKLCICCSTLARISSELADDSWEAAARLPILSAICTVARKVMDLANYLVEMMRGFTNCMGNIGKGLANYRKRYSDYYRMGEGRMLGKRTV